MPGLNYRGLGVDSNENFLSDGYYRDKLAKQFF